MQLSVLTLRELLQLHSGVSAQLRDRGYCRTGNNPGGDIAEHLFSQTFNWKLAANSNAGFDAACPDRGRVQIKSRRLNRPNASRQAGDIRDLALHKFDWLAGVVFGSDWEIVLGVLVPFELVAANSTYIKHTNSSRFYLRDSLIGMEGVEDVTGKLKASWNTMGAI